jgi:hypothetical protein
MEHKHLDAASMDRLLAMDRTDEQTEQLLHLLAVCPACREVGGWLLELHQTGALPPVFGLVDAALARSRAEAPRLLEELMATDHQNRLAVLHADRRFVSLGLCELLVRKSRQIAPENASDAHHLADLAVHVADMLPGDALFEEQWVYQLRSLAWAALANAHRVQGDLAGSERCFEMADSWWEAGTADSEDALGYDPSSSPSRRRCARSSGASPKRSSFSTKPWISSSTVNPSTGIHTSPAGASSRKLPCSSRWANPNPQS